MDRKNVFSETSSRGKYAFAIYSQLLTDKEVTYQSVYERSAFYGKNVPVSKSEGYGELKKAFGDVRNALIARCGEDCWVETGNNRCKGFQYVGSDPDPLADMVNAKVRKNVEDYWQFCQDSEGFFPTSWLDYFFQGTRDLLDIKDKRRNGGQVLSASIDRNLKNIELLPQLYDWIKQGKVLEIQYVPFKESPRKLIFHPQYLKEFNGRWFVLGIAENPQTDHDNILALDRIDGIPTLVSGHPYKAAEKGFFRDHFKDLVGVTLRKGAETVEVRVRAHDYYIFRLTETKKIHPSQQTVVPFGLHDGQKYGEFLIRVKPNNEFFGQILLMGADLEIMSPDSVRQEMAEKVAKMQRLYE